MRSRIWRVWSCTEKLVDLDRYYCGHAGAEGLGIAHFLAVEANLHGHALHHLHPVAGGILGWQEREPRARAGADRVHHAVEVLAGEGIHLDPRRLTRAHARELCLL